MTDTSAYSNLLRDITINKADLFAKFSEGDAVEINGYGFCRHYHFEDEIIVSVLEAINEMIAYGPGTTEENETQSIDELTSFTVFEASFIDEDYNKLEYFVSLKDILENGEILDDGSVAIKHNDSDNVETFTFYRLEQI